MSEHRSAEEWRSKYASGRCSPDFSISDLWNCFYKLISDLQASEERIKELEATNARLNRRCQSAESAAMQNVEKCKKAGASFGRSLANWYGEKLQADFKAAEVSRDALREIAEDMLEWHTRGLGPDDEMDACDKAANDYFKTHPIKPPCGRCGIVHPIGPCPVHSALAAAKKKTEDA